MVNAQKQHFYRDVWGYYDSHSRILPWRTAEPDGSFDPYKILVSEFMLQQTQVARVIPKYQEFITVFPTISALAGTEFAEVLRLWSGLGYNRRAKYLFDAARKLKNEPNPWTIHTLESSKGIGYNTAAAVCVYSYNQPHIFIETNVRTVYIHHFFPREASVNDVAIKAMIDETMERERPREFYWALMDYGAWLKRSGVRNVRQSKHYTVQSPFIGSRRQIRGEVLKILSQVGEISTADLHKQVNDKRLDEVVSSLTAEGLLRRAGQRIKI